MFLESNFVHVRSPSRLICILADACSSVLILLDRIPYHINGPLLDLIDFLFQNFLASLV